MPFADQIYNPVTLQISAGYNKFTTKELFFVFPEHLCIRFTPCLIYFTLKGIVLLKL